MRFGWNRQEKSALLQLAPSQPPPPPPLPARQARGAITAQNTRACRRVCQRARPQTRRNKRREGEVTGKAAETMGLGGWVWLAGTRGSHLGKTREGQRSTKGKLAYNLIRWRAASHPALQFALGVLDGVLRGVRCDDGRAWRQAESTNEVEESEGSR